MAPPPANDEARLDAALDALLAIDDPAASAAWRADFARSEPALSRRLEAILTAADNDLLGEAEPAALADDLIEQHAGLDVGARLGAWRIARLLGRGGMGRVYLAERADGAFEKRVAIKVLRRELKLPAAVLARERALLARLEHPGITRLLDGGRSDDGDVYLVMEYVDGTPLADWCRDHDAGWRERLALLRQVLEAVAAAHRQRVVHGDIKPGNVLVGGDGRARLLDFGVAQLLESPTGTATALALTPAFAAPECIAGKPASVQSDVYSLGALLDTLLTGTAAVARQLPRRADLDAIIAKATAGEPRDRYADVAELVADLDRWRAVEAVAARGGGRLYRLRRFLRRHWFWTTAGAAMALVVISATALLAWQNSVVRSQRDHAQLAAARSQTVLDYLIGVVGSAARDADGGNARFKDLIADGLARIGEDFAGDRDARQQLLARLAELHVRMQDFASAKTLLAEITLDDTTPPLVAVRVLDNRALVALHAGELERAAQRAAAAIAKLEREPANHRGLMSELLVTRARIERRQGHGDAAIATLRKALAMRLAVSPADAAQTVVVRNSLAVALMRAGHYRSALAEFRALDAALASSHRERSLDAANIHNNYAATAFASGEFATAGRQFERALSLQRDFFGPSAGLAALLSNYAKLKLARGDTEAGATLAAKAYAMMQKYAGDDSIDAQLVRAAVAEAALANGDADAAITIYEAIESALGARLGQRHPLLARTRAATLGARARAGRVASDDPAFSRLDAALDGFKLTRARAALACAQGRLALIEGRDTLAAARAQTCRDAWRASQVATSPRLAVAGFLVAEARYRGDPTTAAARDAALAAAVRALAGNHARIAELEALVSA